MGRMAVEEALIEVIYPGLDEEIAAVWPFFHVDEIAWQLTK